jgi:adenylate kinase
VYIIFLGAPGAGKGTQAAGVAKELKLVQVASGDLFRQALEKKTELGLKAKAYMEKGVLVPDEITIGMVLERLALPDTKSGVILDGFPRNLEQAQALDKAFTKQGKAVDKVIYINVKESELLERLAGRWICRKCQAPYHEKAAPPKVKGVCDKCGGDLYQRPDDKKESVKRRLEVYNAETTPLIEYYKKTGKLKEVVGEGAEAEVARRIIAVIKADARK